MTGLSLISHNTFPHSLYHTHSSQTRQAPPALCLSCSFPIAHPCLGTKFALSSPGHPRWGKGARKCLIHRVETSPSFNLLALSSWYSGNLGCPLLRQPPLEQSGHYHAGVCLLCEWLSTNCYVLMGMTALFHNRMFLAGLLRALSAT